MLNLIREFLSIIESYLYRYTYFFKDFFKNKNRQMSESDELKLYLEQPVCSAAVEDILCWWRVIVTIIFFCFLLSA